MRITIELSDQALAELDRIVATEGFESREAAARTALQTALVRPSEPDLAEWYRQAYERVPDDAAWGEVGLRLASDAIRREQE